MKVVSPYKPFEPESPSHRRLDDFDWTDACKMMAHSVLSACDCHAYILSDAPIADMRTHVYQTKEKRLMLWILEVTAMYLESDDFDQDTVFISPDSIVMRNMNQFFDEQYGAYDLMLLYREKGVGRRSVMNSIQFFRHSAKNRLADFYWKCYELSKSLPESEKRWGADTTALVKMLEPLKLGSIHRHGMIVKMIDSKDVFRSLKEEHFQKKNVKAHVIDFKNSHRKARMADYFKYIFGN